MSDLSPPNYKDRSYFSRVAMIFFATFLAASALFQPIRNEVIEIYDEGSYFHAAADIRQNGLLEKFHTANLHSYLYPTALAYGIPSWLGITKGAGRLAVFVLQTVLFLATALAIARAIRPVFGAKRALAIVAMLCLNPFTLIYLGYSLTDSFSLTLTIALVIAVAVSFQAQGPLRVRHACLAGLLLGGAVMTRPGNIYLLSLAVPTFLLHLYRGFRRGALRRTCLACLVAICCALLVCIPESLNRYRNFGKLSPLIVQSGIDALGAARANVKYTTYVGPGAPPAVYYRNPFYNDAGQGGPVSTFDKVRAWTLSTLTKMFGLVDNDFMRPYVYSFTSPDRWIGTIVSLSLVIVGSIGLTVRAWSTFKTLWKSRFVDMAPDQAFALCCLLTVGGCFAVYSQAMPEARFGLPIVAILSLFVPFALDLWWPLTAFARTVGLISFVLLLSLGCVFSRWIQSLSESIVRAWG
jgi:hypothetical protein